MHAATYTTVPCCFDASDLILLSYYASATRANCSSNSVTVSKSLFPLLFFPTSLSIQYPEQMRKLRASWWNMPFELVHSTPSQSYCPSNRKACIKNSTAAETSATIHFLKLYIKCKFETFLPRQQLAPWKTNDLSLKKINFMSWGIEKQY